MVCGQQLVQNQVTPCRVCEFRGLENLRNAWYQRPQALRKLGVSEREMLEKYTCDG